jgi:hypothetical protein
MAAMTRRVERSPGLLIVTLALLVAGSCGSSKLGLIRSLDAGDGAIDRLVALSDGARDGTPVDRTTVDRMVGDRTVVDAAVEARPDAVATCAGLPRGAPAPVGACPDAGVASCGFDGTCDGAGGCHRYAAGAVCAAPTCLDSATFQPVSLCDGQGTCVASLPLLCSPYTCVNDACDVDDCKFIPTDCVATPHRDASSG